MRVLICALATLVILVAGLSLVGLADETPAASAAVSRDCWVGMVAYELHTGEVHEPTGCSDPIDPGTPDWTCDFTDAASVHCDPIEAGSPEFVDCAMSGVNYDCTGGPDGPASYLCSDAATDVSCFANVGPTNICTPSGEEIDCQVLDGQGDYNCVLVASESFFSCESVEPVFYLFGDTDCGGVVNLGDAISIARDLVDLPVNQQPECPALGTTVVVGDDNVPWGDVDCSHAVSLGDAIALSRFLVSLPINAPAGCPALGVLIEVG